MKKCWALPALLPMFTTENTQNFPLLSEIPGKAKVGIGAELLKRCLSISKDRGIEKVTGIVLPENTQMLALARKLGFNAKKVTGESDYKLAIDLTKL